MPDNGLYVIRYNEECTPDNAGDGYCADVDCDDNDPNVNPGVQETCDGVDNNCDGQTDGGINCVGSKSYLTGAYESGTGMMRDDLNRGGFIPITEPYTGLGYDFVVGGGETITDLSILSVQGDNGIVDWVVLELRNKADNTEVLYSRAALIQRDGDIVEVDGVNNVDCTDVDFDDYFLAIRHRNHLGVMSDDPIDLSGTNSYNFTDGSMSLFGTDPLFEISGGVMGLWPGNANMDGQIKYNGSSNDKNAILSEVGLLTPNNTVMGYFLEDVNMDGRVKYNGSTNDKNEILSKVGLLTPNNTITEQIPN